MELVKTFNNILKNFAIKATCVNSQQLDNYLYFDLKLDPNGKIRDLQKYSNEIALHLQMEKPSIKILHQKGVIRFEFISSRDKTLKLFDYFTNDSIPKGELNCLLGQTVDGSRMWMDLAQNPHLLISGTTGSGKSVLLHNIIANILNYSEAAIYLVDPKQIEFVEYSKNLPQISVQNTYSDAVKLLSNALKLMDSRYDMIKKGVPVSTFKPMVIIIDEFADLIMQDKNDEFYILLCRLAQKCRAAKIHLVIATQRPSVNIISGVIKANFPARIACRVASHTDSKVILDTSGAEGLLGKGDALLRDNLRSLERFQVAYTDAKEVCSMFGVQ